MCTGWSQDCHSLRCFCDWPEGKWTLSSRLWYKGWLICSSMKARRLPWHVYRNDGTCIGCVQHHWTGHLWLFPEDPSVLVIKLFVATGSTKVATQPKRAPTLYAWSDHTLPVHADFHHDGETVLLAIRPACRALIQLSRASRWPTTTIWTMFPSDRSTQLRETKLMTSATISEIHRSIHPAPNHGRNSIRRSLTAFCPIQYVGHSIGDLHLWSGLRKYIWWLRVKPRRSFTERVDYRLLIKWFTQNNEESPTASPARRKGAVYSFNVHRSTFRFEKRRTSEGLFVHCGSLRTIHVSSLIVHVQSCTE